MKYNITFIFKIDGVTHAFLYKVEADTPIDALINARAEHSTGSLRDKPAFNTVFNIDIERTSHL